jgi:GST-like protein
MDAMKKPLLIGCAGCGSVIVESAFNLAAMPYNYEEIDYSDDSPTRPRLLDVNPLGQVPGLVLPDGQVITESFAMMHWLQDQSPSTPLVPPKGDPSRTAFYRWGVFLVAALYPTWTYGDDGKKWVGGDEVAGKALRASTDAHRQRLLKQMELACKAPHFLGERFSAIDLYLATMIHWRPGRKWWEPNVPKLTAVADAAKAKPEVGRTLARDFK